MKSKGKRRQAEAGRREWKRAGRTKGVVGVRYSRLADGRGLNSGRRGALSAGSGDLGETTELVETMAARDEGETFHPIPGLPQTRPFCPGAHQRHPRPRAEPCHCIRVPDRLTPRRMAARTGLCTPRTPSPFSPPYLQTDFTCNAAEGRNYIASIHQLVCLRRRLPSTAVMHCLVQFFGSAQTADSACGSLSGI